MKKLGKVLLAILGVLLALALLLLAVRLVNGFRYPEPPALAVNLDPASYPTTVPGATVERVDLDRLQGFHLSPDTPSHDGLVVIWGGSDGGPDFARAARIAGQGYHVLSLFFFGQPGQQPILAEVPLEAFEDALRWRAEHAPGPLTVIGTSKGAELALDQDRVRRLGDLDERDDRVQEDERQALPARFEHDVGGRLVKGAPELQRERGDP